MMTPTDNMRAPGAAPPSTAALMHLAGAELSLRSRVGYVALLLAAAMMTTVISALWITEPPLPLRTQLAFALMIAIGVSWVIFAVWALTHRRPLLAGHAIVAGRMAVTFTALFVIGALALGRATGSAAPYAAAAGGVLMLGTAAVLLRRAHSTSARLTERRDTLARELGRRTK